MTQPFISPLSHSTVFASLMAKKYFLFLVESRQKHFPNVNLPYSLFKISRYIYIIVCLDLHCDSALVIISRLWNAGQLRTNKQKWFKGWLLKRELLNRLVTIVTHFSCESCLLFVAIHYPALLFLHTAMSNAALRCITALENAFSLLCRMPYLNTFLHLQCHCLAHSFYHWVAGYIK